MSCMCVMQDVKVADWVAHGLGLPQYAETFRSNSITVSSRLQLPGKQRARHAARHSAAVQAGQPEYLSGPGCVAGCLLLVCISLQQLANAEIAAVLIAGVGPAHVGQRRWETAAVRAQGEQHH